MGKVATKKRTVNLFFKMFASKTFNQINLSFYSLYYAKACNKFAGPIYASLRTGNITSFKEMPHRWQAVGNCVSD